MGLFKTAVPTLTGRRIPLIDLAERVSTQRQRVLIIRASEPHFKAGWLYFWRIRCPADVPEILSSQTFTMPGWIAFPRSLHRFPLP